MSDRLSVRLADRAAPLLVGEMADGPDGPYFQYDPAFLTTGILISPIHLPPGPNAFPPGPRGLGGLRGVFADSVPDGWGLKILHQTMRDVGLDPMRATRSVHLRVLGSRAMGALTYAPAHPLPQSSPPIDLETLAANAFRVDADHIEELLPALRNAGGSPGGARPKAVLSWHNDGRIGDAFSPLAHGFRHVMVKFRAQSDSQDQPAIESAYLSMALAAGIDVPEHRVTQLGSGELALIVDRFDRVGNERRHVHTLAGLLEVDIRDDLVDYEHLLGATSRITQDMRQVAAAFRRAVFNVAAFNRDDHAKNIAFLMSPSGTWSLAPAYDLTYSAGANGGYHAMSVMGESKEPSRADFVRLGTPLEKTQIAEIIDEVRAGVHRWDRVSDAAGIAASRRKEVATQLTRQSTLLARSDRPKGRKAKA